MPGRRSILKAGLATVGALCTGSMPRLLLAQSAGGSYVAADSYSTASGTMTVHPISHASLVIDAPGITIYNDPVGAVEKYSGLPPADLILVTHEHGDHFKTETLEALLGDDTRLVVNPAVYGKLQGVLKDRAEAIGNGDTTTVRDVDIAAIGAYNLTADRLKYHPKGRDNGYVLKVDGKLVYIAGDTEAIPEMRALRGIDIAFIPMNNPYTMEVDQAADGVLEFAPSVVYPYHYKGSDIDQFERLVNNGNAALKVIKGAWYS